MRTPENNEFELSALIFGAQRPQQVVPFAGAVKWDVLSRLWFGQSTTLDAMHLAVWLSGMGLQVPVGFAVSLLPLKSPTQAAIEARSAAALLGTSVVAGFGPGSREFQIGVGGHPYRRPLHAMREYVQAFRVLVGAEDPVPVTDDGDGPIFFPRPVGALPAMHCPPVEVGLGVLRPNSAKLAGELADRAITWLLPSRYLRDVIVPNIEQGSTGRRRPKVSAIVPVGLSGPKRDPMAIAAAAMARHLQEPHYQDAVRKAGIPVTGHDVEADLRAVTKGSLLCFGSAAEVSDQLSEYVHAGADEVVLNLSGVAQTVGMKAALEDLRTLTEHMKGTEVMLRNEPKTTEKRYAHVD